MALVSVKNKYQVVIPLHVRKKIGIKVGDLLEASVERGSIVCFRRSCVNGDSVRAQDQRGASG